MPILMVLAQYFEKHSDDHPKIELVFRAAGALYLFPPSPLQFPLSLIFFSIFRRFFIFLSRNSHLIGPGKA